MNKRGEVNADLRKPQIDSWLVIWIVPNHYYVENEDGTRKEKPRFSVYGCMDIYSNDGIGEYETLEDAVFTVNKFAQYGIPMVVGGQTYMEAVVDKINDLTNRQSVLQS